jgi:hypothetical protein
VLRISEVISLVVYKHERSQLRFDWVERRE